MRDEHNLSQISLGEIDPSSEALRLATLGMRNVAANYLWLKSQDFQKTEDWESLSATLNQITKLQPNFLEVWKSQSHNLSYNVSREFDDYRHRYHWVKKGIDFLVKGVHYNAEEPILLHTAGKFTGQKMGVADEKVLFRELFRDDNDWHSVLSSEVPDITGPIVKGPTGRPDNWLTARLWYLRGEAAVDRGSRMLRGSSPLIFHSDRPKQRINFAQAIQNEGYFDQATEAWRDGGNEWTEEFGSRTIPSSWGVSFQLGEKNQVLREAGKLREQLDELLPGAREELEAELFKKLTKVEQRAYKSTEEDRATWTEEVPEAHVYFKAIQKMEFSDMDVAKRAPPEVRAKARRLGELIEEKMVLADRINRYRGIVNFDYWAMRADAEQTQMVADARKHLFAASEKLNEADLEGAQADYEAAWDLWDQIFDRWPALKAQDSFTDLKPELLKYRRVLNHQNKPDIAPDFKLAWLLDEAELAAIEAQFKERQGTQDSDAETSQDVDAAKSPATPTSNATDNNPNPSGETSPAKSEPASQTETGDNTPLPPLEASPAQEPKEQEAKGNQPPVESETQNADEANEASNDMPMPLGFVAHLQADDNGGLATVRSFACSSRDKESRSGGCEEGRRRSKEEGGGKESRGRSSGKEESRSGGCEEGRRRSKEEGGGKESRGRSGGKEESRSRGCEEGRRRSKKEGGGKESRGRSGGKEESRSGGCEEGRRRSKEEGGGKESRGRS